ncbi:DUF6531 domain-containing protein [Shewanella denitrificans]
MKQHSKCRLVPKGSKVKLINTFFFIFAVCFSNNTLAINDRPMGYPEGAHWVLPGSHSTTKIMCKGETIAWQTPLKDYYGDKSTCIELLYANFYYKAPDTYGHPNSPATLHSCAYIHSQYEMDYIDCSFSYYGWVQNSIWTGDGQYQDKGGRWIRLARGGNLRNVSTRKCAPDEHPDYQEEFDFDGDGLVDRCYNPADKKVCTFPYLFDMKSSECTAYCPPSSPKLNPLTGQCESEGPKQCEMKAGNPVVIATGEKVQVEEPDYKNNKAFPIVFTRNYRSLRSPDAKPNISALYNKAIQLDFNSWTKYIQPQNYQGIDSQYSDLTSTTWTHNITGYIPPNSGHKQWRHSYQKRIYWAGNQATLMQPTGADLQFVKMGEHYVSTQSTGLALTPVKRDGIQTGWQIRFQNKPNEIYDLNGRLVKIQQSATLYQTLSYDGSNNLSHIIHSLGGGISLTYNSVGQLTQLAAFPDDVKINYLYDNKGNLLFTTAAPRQYHYEDKRYPYALTGITNERGKRYVTWKYDNSGRVVENVKADNQQRFVFSYNGELSTTVTNPLGKKTTYHFSTDTGDKRYTRIVGEASNNCVATNQTYSYYATTDKQGLVHQQTDWNGNITEFDYNSRGLVTKEIRGVGTDEAVIITTEWHPFQPWPIKITAGNEVTEYRYDESGNVVSQTHSAK